MMIVRNELMPECFRGMDHCIRKMERESDKLGSIRFPMREGSYLIETQC